MSFSFEFSIEVSEPYSFSKDALGEIEKNTWVRNQWPLVYFIRNDRIKIAYVGESTNALSRIKNHLANPDRSQLETISIISSDKFNKSATLDIESTLIQYITAEGTYQLQNGNYGLINHQYYQQDIYRQLFKEIWNKLIVKKIVSKSLSEIENSILFKYSPYKALNEEQYKSVLEIIQGLTQQKTNRIFVSGSAGTGKTILATYLIKLLSSDPNSFQDEELNEDEIRETSLIKAFQKKFPQAKIGFVIAMTSLRESIQTVFRNIPGLKPSMVINPSETFSGKEKYDLLIVDEAHRLRKYKNISWMGAFKKNNGRLGLDQDGTELDWILANSKNQIFFYDAAQSVKPSDVDAEKFDHVLRSDNTIRLELKSQMRVRGGQNYISFVDDLLSVRLTAKKQFESANYELLLFNNFQHLYAELGNKENQLGLCRMIAGYAWPWKSSPKLKPPPDPDVKDIELDGLHFKWNSTDKDWINSKNAFQEVGCIHTTQGYDLNYAAVIFGSEIDYDFETNEIIIHPKNYHDINGKKGVKDNQQLKAYIINIYKTMMYRGIKGTYIYACNKNLRTYLTKHIQVFQPANRFKVIPLEQVEPYSNAIPLLDITAAAGTFSGLQIHEELTWVDPSPVVEPKTGYFICQVVGESMNEVIPNGSYCLFKQYEGGSRNGKIVLVESTHIHDQEFGSGYTIKQYHSMKNINDDQWNHESIVLKPLSSDERFRPITLQEHALETLKVLGVFERVL